MKKYLLALAEVTLCLAICVAVLTACGKKRQPKEEPMFSEADTATVLKLTEDYLDLVKEHSYDAAVAMLHDILKDSVRDLSPEREAGIREQQKMFPVLNYERTGMEFVNPHRVRVSYSVEFFEKAEGSNIPNTYVLMFEPQRIKGEWYLELSDRSHSR